MESSFVDSWKNKKVFEKQLKLNLTELDNYPGHWTIFIAFLSSIQEYGTKNIIDVGCGCGTYSELCKRHFPSLKYKGVDYAEEAIEIARNQWPGIEFECKSYKDLKKEEFGPTDILHAGALHNVLSNGDECLEFFLSLQVKYILLGRLITTLSKSYALTYKAYDEITTYKFFHDINKVKKLFTDYNYEYSQLSDNFLLIRK